VFAFVWAVGGNLVRSVQEEFDEFARDQLAPVSNFPGARE
jgi:dynein heavy chain